MAITPQHEKAEPDEKDLEHAYNRARSHKITNRGVLAGKTHVKNVVRWTAFVWRIYEGLWLQRL